MKRTDTKIPTGLALAAELARDAYQLGKVGLDGEIRLPEGCKMIDRSLYPPPGDVEWMIVDLPPGATGAENRNRREMAVVFPGTESWRDFRRDFRATPKKWRTYGRHGLKGMAHAGAVTAERLTERVCGIYTYQPDPAGDEPFVWWIGHSMGAGPALLGYLRRVEAWFGDGCDNNRFFGFGPMRTLSYPFARRLRAAGYEQHAYSCSFGSDAVPTMPPWFARFGQRIHMRLSGKVTERGSVKWGAVSALVRPGFTLPKDHAVERYVQMAGKIEARLRLEELAGSADWWGK